jgi:hypothetical protein
MVSSLTYYYTFFIPSFDVREILWTKYLGVLFFLGLPLQSFAQVDSTATSPSKQWEISGVVDLFYGYDFNQAKSGSLFFATTIDTTK